MAALKTILNQYNSNGAQVHRMSIILPIKGSAWLVVVLVSLGIFRSTRHHSLFGCIISHLFPTPLSPNLQTKIKAHHHDGSN